MNEKQSENDSRQALLVKLEEWNEKIEAAYVDPRFGSDEEFTKQANSLAEIAGNLRERLRDDSTTILLSDSSALLEFLEEIGIHKDHMEFLQAGGKIAGSLASTLETVLKAGHPMFFVSALGAP